MLPKLPRALLLVLLHAVGRGTTQRRRGGGGGGGGGSDEIDFDDIDFDDDFDDSYDPVIPPPPPPVPEPECDMSKCACVMVDERTAQCELPGMYYNGTVTVTHKLEDSSMWLYEEPGRNPEENSLWCTNNDRNTKTYQYPALIFVGNPGNDSDTNPIFWILRGYQPANQTEHLDDDDEPTSMCDSAGFIFDRTTSSLKVNLKKDNREASTDTLKPTQQKCTGKRVSTGVPTSLTTLRTSLRFPHVLRTSMSPSSLRKAERGFGGPIGVTRRIDKTREQASTSP